MNWTGAIIGGAIALLVTREVMARRKPDYTEAEWLARLIILEAGNIGASDEWAAIMQVALNRVTSPRYGDDLRSVVATTKWPGGGSRGRAWVEAVQAEGGVGYRSAHGHPAPPDHRRYVEALEFAELVLSGGVSNRIGERTHFYHPRGMARCVADLEGQWNLSGSRMCIDGRWVPKWGIEQFAEFEPIRVGRAVFC